MDGIHSTEQENLPLDLNYESNGQGKFPDQSQGECIEGRWSLWTVWSQSLGSLMDVEDLSTEDFAKSVVTALTEKDPAFRIFIQEKIFVIKPKFLDVVRVEKESQSKPGPQQELQIGPSQNHFEIGGVIFRPGTRFHTTNLGKRWRLIAYGDLAQLLLNDKNFTEFDLKRNDLFLVLNGRVMDSCHKIFLNEPGRATQIIRLISTTIKPGSDRRYISVSYKFMETWKLGGSSDHTVLKITPYLPDKHNLPRSASNTNGIRTGTETKSGSASPSKISRISITNTPPPIAIESPSRVNMLNGNGVSKSASPTYNKLATSPVCRRPGPKSRTMPSPRSGIRTPFRIQLAAATTTTNGNRTESRKSPRETGTKRKKGMWTDSESDDSARDRGKAKTNENEKAPSPAETVPISVHGEGERGVELIDLGSSGEEEKQSKAQETPKSKSKKKLVTNKGKRRKLYQDDEDEDEDKAYVISEFESSEDEDDRGTGTDRNRRPNRSRSRSQSQNPPLTNGGNSNASIPKPSPIRGSAQISKPKPKPGAKGKVKGDDKVYEKLQVLQDTLSDLCGGSIPIGNGNSSDDEVETDDEYMVFRKLDKRNLYGVVDAVLQSPGDAPANDEAITGSPKLEAKKFLIRISDETKEGVLVRICTSIIRPGLKASLSELPAYQVGPIVKVGDIIRIHRATVQFEKCFDGGQRYEMVISTTPHLNYTLFDNEVGNIDGPWRARRLATRTKVIHDNDPELIKNLRRFTLKRTLGKGALAQPIVNGEVRQPNENVAQNGNLQLQPGTSTQLQRQNTHTRSPPHPLPLKVTMHSSPSSDDNFFDASSDFPSPPRNLLPTPPVVQSPPQARSDSDNEGEAFVDVEEFTSDTDPDLQGENREKQKANEGQTVTEQLQQQQKQQQRSEQEREQNGNECEQEFYDDEDDDGSSLSKEDFEALWEAEDAAADKNDRVILVLTAVPDSQSHSLSASPEMRRSPIRQIDLPRDLDPESENENENMEEIGPILLKDLTVEICETNKLCLKGVILDMSETVGNGEDQLCIRISDGTETELVIEDLFKSGFVESMRKSSLQPHVDIRIKNISKDSQIRRRLWKCVGSNVPLEFHGIRAVEFNSEEAPLEFRLVTDVSRVFV